MSLFILSLVGELFIILSLFLLFVRVMAVLALRAKQLELTAPMVTFMIGYTLIRVSEFIGG